MFDIKNKLAGLGLRYRLQKTYQHFKTDHKGVVLVVGIILVAAIIL